MAYNYTFINNATIAIKVNYTSRVVTYKQFSNIIQYKMNTLVEASKTYSGIKIISNQNINDALNNAVNSERKRIPILFNQYDERPIRSIRCLDTNAYIRPHIHNCPNMYEVLVPMDGDFKLITFNSKGVVIDILNLISDNTNNEYIRAVEIPPFVYHTIVCMSANGSYLEINSLSDKKTIEDMTFPSWAPEDNSNDTLNLLKQASVGTIIK